MMKMSTKLRRVVTGNDSTVVAQRGTTDRKKRHHLWAPFRYLLVLAMGSSVGLLASYALRYAGM